MDELTKYERMFKTLRREEVDRLPWSVYLHATVHDRGVPNFANYTINFHNRFEPDYVKVMLDENYESPVNFQYAWNINIWDQFETLDPHNGAFGRQLENLKIIKDAVGPDVPVFQTIYAPFSWTRRLNMGFVEHYRENAAIIDRAVSTITDSTIAFARACINEAGIDGFFYGLFCCDSSWMTEEEFVKWSIPHDKRVLAVLRNAPMLITHIHGAKDIFFDACKDLEGDGLSWEDRAAGPSFPEARKKSEKAFVGGINIQKAVKATPEEVYAEGLDAIEQAGGRGLLLAPGCTFLPGTPVENMFALKRAVYDHAKKKR